MRILFVLKERFYGSSEKSYGLINSSNYVNEFLNDKGYQSKVVTVVDGNGIDKEVYNYKPDVVIIEALWVAPKKMAELLALGRYKHITWVVRIHSDMGFLACEGQALNYINEYDSLKNQKLIISFNNYHFAHNLSKVLKTDFVYLPNIVKMLPIKKYNRNRTFNDDGIHVGCFGSLRALKNQCFQAICCIEFANRMCIKLNFHITSDITPDGHQNPVLNNLRELFKNSGHNLIIHQWMDNSEFKNLVSLMDFGIQLSFTESFNIVASDFVNQNKLILVSDNITWMPDMLKTSTTNYSEVIQKLEYVYGLSPYIRSKLIMAQRENLELYAKQAGNIWYNFIEDLIE